MKAVVIHEHGNIDQLRYEEVPVPSIRAHEVLVEIRAVALNHLDIWVRKGWPALKLAMPHILGSDVAGVVADRGGLVRNVAPGDKVLIAPGWGCGSCHLCLAGQDNYCSQYKVLGENTPGGYSTYVKVPGANAFPIPNGLSYDEGAAIPLVFLTAWNMLVDQARVSPGEDVLVLAAGSGVGSAAIQIAKLFAARVIATAGSPEKLSKATELGADEVVDHGSDDWLERVNTLTQNKGVDIVFEHVGKATWANSIKALKKGGRLVICGATTGFDPVLDLRYIFFKGLKIFGNFMGRKDGLARALTFFPEKLRPVVDTTFPLQEAARAHTRLANREQFGKIVLNP